MDAMDLEVLMDIVKWSFNLGLCYAEAELEQLLKTRGLTALVP